MRRIISFLLVFALIMSYTVSVSAAVMDGVQPRYTYVLDVQAIPSINESTGIASCSGSITTRNTYPVKVDVHLQMQENTGWTTLKTWSSTGTLAATVAKAWAVYSGHNYRVLVVGFVYDSNGNIIESASVYHTVYYPPK